MLDVFSTCATPGSTYINNIKFKVWKKLNIQFLGVVPEDKELTEFEFSGRPLVELGDESPVYSTVAAMMAKLFD